MTELTQEKKDKLLKLATFEKSPELGILNELSDVNETLKVIAEKENQEIPKFPTEMTVKMDGISVITLKGDSPTDEHLIELIKPLIPNPIPANDGYTPKKGKDYFDGSPGKNADPVDVPAIVSQASAMTEARLMQFIPTVEDIENDLPKLGQQIRDSLELLQGDDRLDVSAIKGLKENMDNLLVVASKPPIMMGSVAGRDIFKDIDLSSQLDGVTKTFNISAVWTIISVDLSSFPYGSLRKNVDYTWTPTTITFTDQIDASTQLSAGQSCILTVVNS